MRLRDLVRPDHVLLGARASGYPGVRDSLAALTADHEQRIGRQIHLPMSFAKPGFLPVPGRESRPWFQRRAMPLLQCWKPVHRWADATGNDYDVNMYLMRCAVAVRDSKLPVLMVLHHEPENDVGRSGSAEEYRAMWKHVRDVFELGGATNAAWGMAYMNYPKWTPLIGSLWPVEADPEWVFFNAYGSPARPDYDVNIGSFYEGLAEDRWFASGAKLWGVREWSVKGLDRAAARRYFDAARKAAREDEFPKLRAHVVFDSPGKEGLSEMRIGYDEQGRRDAVKADLYRRFAHDPMFGPVTVPGW